MVGREQKHLCLGCVLRANHWAILDRVIDWEEETEFVWMCAFICHASIGMCLNDYRLGKIKFHWYVIKF